MTERTLPNLDLIDEEFLTKATTTDGPWVTILLPTHRTGRETLASRALYQNLLKLAEQELTGVTEGAQLLSALHELAEERDFWLNQSDGLAVFAAPGFLRTFRLPMSLPEEVSVGEHPRLRPLVSLIAVAGGSFDLLALSGKHVRLFEGTRGSIGQLALPDDVPESTDDVYQERDHQTYMQQSAQNRGGPANRGGRQANFHGHGGDNDAAQSELEKFFRYVDAGVGEVLGRDSKRPLVLAGVAEHGVTYKAVSNHKRILDEMVTGNPDHLSAQELHAGAWPIVEEVLRASDSDLADKYNELVGTGKASSDASSIAGYAKEGRVETLLLRPDAPSPDGQPSVVIDHVDQLIIDTLRNGGALALSDDESADPVRAVLRY